MKYRRENKNEAKEIKEGIVSLKKQKGVFKEYQQRGKRLIVGYSEKRAKKDEYNRNKGVDRLEKSFKSGKITKDQVNKRGYNKFLSISENVKVRSEEHTSELQSRGHLVCRLLLEKKKK